jgi:PKD repeat protein
MNVDVRRNKGLRVQPQDTHRAGRRRTHLRVESLESRDVPAPLLALDFNTNSSPTAAGYTGVKPVPYTSTNHLGWENLVGITATDRQTGNALTRDFHCGVTGTFLADVPNGVYNVVVGLGDATTVRDNVGIWAEGQALATNVKTPAGKFLEARGRVTVTDGRLTLRLEDSGGSTGKFALSYLRVTPDDPNAPSHWPADAKPTANPSSTGQPLEVGVRFRPAADGFITGLRFYKAAGSTGSTHTGSLWTGTGTRLATATFTGETASGWQTVQFSSPVAVRADTTYVASYLVSRGQYSADSEYFTISGVTNGSLTVPSTAQGGGGVSGPGGTFPTSTTGNKNYWVDVTYERSPAAPFVAGVTPANNAINVATSAVVRVTFSEAMNPATVTAGTVLLQTGSGANVPASVTYDPTTFTATLTPGAALTAGSSYTVRVKGGAGGVADASGEPMAADFTSSFSTAAGPVTASAGPDKTGNEGSTVSFTGTAGGGVGGLTYTWNWGDGTANTTGTLTPTHTYADNGSYTVTLTVTDANNQTATDTAAVTVSNVAPTATVSNNGPVNTNTNVSINFANQADVSSADVAAGFRYSFDFDNNGTWEVTDSTTASATTQYATAGNKTVRARIKDKDGAFTDYTTTVAVNGVPTANAGADKTGNEGSAVSFTGTAGGGVGTLTYTWNWGDGTPNTTGTLTPNHTYADNGTYTVTLTVTDANSQTATDTAAVAVSNVAPTATVSNNGPVYTNSDVTINFANQADVSAPDAAAGFRYSFDFNNDGTWEITDSTTASATTQYGTTGNKTVRTRIKDKDGGTTTYNTSVAVNGPPTANAGVDKTGNEGSSISFTGTAGGGAGALTYRWSWGDGTPDTTGTLSPSHTYADNGSYTVTLTVTDANNQTATDTAAVTVSNVAPTGTVSNNGPVYTNTNVSINFANQADVSSADVAAGFRYSFDFDNNGTWEVTDSTTASATTQYATVGNKTVRARIKDKDGGLTDYTTTVAVNGLPTANAGVDKTGNEGSSISFTGTAGGGAGTLTYRWNWGDGTPDTTGTLSPTHTYADNGSYTVTLTVTDANSQTATDTAAVTVSNVAPTGTVSNSGPVNTNTNVTISFANQADVSSADTAAGFRYSFDFDNNGTWEVTDSTTASASTQYGTAGNKTVRARIKDKDGAFTDYTTTVTVNPPNNGLAAYFNFDEGSGTAVGSTVGGHTGTISGATWVAAGQSGAALSFDGVNDRVIVPDSNSLDLTTGMTLEAWVRPAAVGGWQTVAFKERGTTEHAYALYASDDTGKAAGTMYTGGASDISVVNTANTAAGTWTHLATTFDGSNFRLYVNGSLVRTTAHTGSITTTNNNLSIGGNAVWGEYFNGLIDELRIYNRALSAAEIQTDMDVAPTVSAVNPANGTTGVATNTPVTVTFSEPMDAATITTSSVQLKTAGGSVVSAALSYNATNRQATLTPSAALAAGATYTVAVYGGTGANAVKDAGGKPMAADFTSTFTTSNGSPPTANAGADQTGNEGSSLSFTGTSTGGTGTKTYSWNWGDGTANTTGTLTPTHTYADNGSYTVTLTVTDANSQTATDTATVTVSNVAPTGAVSNSGPVNTNTNVTISLGSQADPSSADVAAGFRYSFDFDNNGTWEVTDSTTASAATQYATAGNKTVRARIKDKDGAFTDYTTTVVVNTPGQGATFYVSPSGNDSNSGSSGSPWRTLQKASDMAQPGDTVVVRAGTYSGFNIARSGTSAARITYQAEAGAVINTPWTLSGVRYGINGSGREYVTIEGFTFTPQSSQGEWYAAVRLGGTGTEGEWVRGNIVRNNTIQMRVVNQSSTPDKYGIYSSWNDGLLVENNTVSGTYNSLIYTANSAKNYTVRGNTVFDGGGNGIHNNGDAGSGQPGIIVNALIERNIVRNTGFGLGGQGISCDGVQDSRIQNNLVYDQHAKGISLYTQDAAGGSIRNVIVNNTILVADDGGAPLRLGSQASQNTIFNNIFYTARDGWPWVDADSNALTGAKIDYNVIGEYEFVNGGNNSTWHTTLGFDTHSVEATPAQLFVNPGANDYRLKAGSPAINVGIGTFNSKTAPTTDLLGSARPFGGGYDIGAYEFTG